MKTSRNWRDIVFSDVGILILLALALLIAHILINGQYGFHRDELDTLDNARYLDWGYVNYPPVTPFIARVAITLFGSTLFGARLFSSLAHALAVVLTGLMARELGGNRWAQVTAAIAVAIAPFVLLGGTFLTYSTFDYLSWVLIAYQMIRLLKSNDPRWWLGIGAVIGVGMMTKYAIAFLVAGIVVGVILTRVRRHLASPWLWSGVALSILIFLPNLIWQIQHNFISLDFLSSIHARDVRQGRTEGFLIEQLIFAANLATIPVWLAGLYYYFFAGAGRNYRLVSWMILVPFALLVITQGRSYYFAPAYPMLFAGGAVIIEQWLSRLSTMRVRIVQGIMWCAFAGSGVLFALIAMPIVPINSPLWDMVSDINGELKEMIGWEELTQTVAEIYAQIPAAEKPRTGILTGNYGEAGAINLYGGAYGLPKAISAVNTYWLRGYGNPPPETVIVLGEDLASASYYFETCKVSGYVNNKYNVLNEETRDHPVILVCRGLKLPWSEFWTRIREFG